MVISEIFENNLQSKNDKHIFIIIYQNWKNQDFKSSFSGTWYLYTLQYQRGCMLTSWRGHLLITTFETLLMIRLKRFKSTFTPLSREGEPEFAFVPKPTLAPAKFGSTTIFRIATKKIFTFFSCFYVRITMFCSAEDEMDDVQTKIKKHF